jgi:NH3-dependent NAD+ synthetase
LDESIKIPPQAGLGITKTDMDEIQAPNYWVVDSILKCIVSNEEFDDDIDLEVKERILDRVLKNEYKKNLPIVIERESLIN